MTERNQKIHAMTTRTRTAFNSSAKITNDDRSRLKTQPKQDADMTAHDMDKHIATPMEHSKTWWSFWGNKCPVCGVVPKIVRE